MDYALAKELKDAGFLQRSSLPPKWKYCIETKNGENVYKPILEELIEMCWEVGTFDSLYYYGEDEYEAVGMRGSEEVNGRGKTPTEAVARLWLALQSKVQKV